MNKQLLRLHIHLNIRQWITDFLSERAACTARSHLSDFLAISTGAPQVWALLPLSFSLYTNDPRIRLLMFTENTSRVGLISKNVQSMYRREAFNLVLWCKKKKSHTAKHNKEFGGGGLKRKKKNSPSCHPLETTFMNTLKWSNHINVIWKATHCCF